jgi:serine/threonine protein kinase
MVTELVEGRVLSAVVRDEGPLSVSDAVQVTVQIADALDAIHQQQIVHGGLSLNSIVLTQDGIARLVDLDNTDLGATTRELLHRQAADATSTLAPEQLAGGLADTRADVYALGVVLYALLTGAPPFAGGDVAAQLAARLRVEPSEPSRLNPAVPPDLDRTVLMALLRDPTRRIPSAAAFRDTLRQIGQRSRVDTQVFRRPALAAATAQEETSPHQSNATFPAPPASAASAAMPIREPRSVRHGRGWSGLGVPGRMIWAGALVAVVALVVLGGIALGLFEQQPGASDEQWATFARPSCEWSNVSTPPGICFGERPAGYRVRILNRTGSRWQVWDPTTQGPAYVDGDALKSE